MLKEKNSKTIFRVPPAISLNNRFGGTQIPQNPWIADNNFGSPHQDSWCSESVSLDGPNEQNLLRTIQNNPYGFTPNMVCNSDNLMIGVSTVYETLEFWLIVFDENCDILSATSLGNKTNEGFGGGYFYLDNDDNVIVIQENQIASYPTKDISPQETVFALKPNWISNNIVELVTGSPDENSLYSCLPVWDEERPNLYWCLLSGLYDFRNYPESNLEAPAMIAVVEISPDENEPTNLISSMELENQWNNNTFAVDETAAYLVTNGLDENKAVTTSYLWAFSLVDDKIEVKWQTKYENSGDLKPGQTNIGSGTTPTLTKTDEMQYVAITDNANPRLNVMVCNRETGEVICKTPCFNKLRSAAEASLIGVGSYFIVENNFGHEDPTYPFSQLVANEPGMEMIDLSNELEDEQKLWCLDNIHFYAMTMLCRGSGIIFAHTCDWSGPLSAEQGGVYYISAIDSYNGRVIWRIPLGRGVDYCHEYGGIYFNRNGDLFIGTNQNLVSISKLSG